MLQCACRISSVGDLLGTGFLITVESEKADHIRYGYVVTAQHVVANQLEVSVETADPLNFGLLHDPVEVSRWRQPLPGADLAIAPFPPGERLIAIELEQHVAAGGVMPPPRLGGHIYYLGVFEPLDRVMARSGTIGALDQFVPSHSQYPMHLVDCRSYAGFSGSPCFAEVAIVTDRPSQPPYEWDRLYVDLEFTALAYFQYLCGMFVGHFSDDISACGVTSRYGVGVMVRSDEIRQALMAPEALAERRGWDEQGFMS